MSELDAKQFELGETLSGKDADGNFINLEVLGSVCTHAAPSYTKGQTQRLTGRPIVAVAIRNVSGGTLAAGTVVSASTSDTVSGCRIPQLEAAAAATTGATGNVFVIDDRLSTSVADDDICWGIVRGPVKVTLDAASTGVTAGDALVSAASGKVIEQGTNDGGLIIGYALEAGSAGDTIMMNAASKVI